MKFYFYPVVWILVFCSLFDLSFAQSDSVVLIYKEYLENIINYHPIAKKADLRIRLAKAEMLGAKGNIDPVISSDWNQKDFDNKLYYRQYRVKLKFPTPLGIDLIGGYENTEGSFLNPENKTDNSGLWHFGIEVNILQGLVINERKTALDQARVFKILAENQQRIILNELIYNATLAYLLWQKYYYFNNVLNENILIASTYFENTKQSFLNGEKTSMDTLEALILYQDAINILQKNEINLIKSMLNVENYLWFNELPVALQEGTKPENYQNQYLPKVANWNESIDIISNPSISASLNKLSYLEIEQKLKREKLKPKLKLKYNPLLSSSDNNIFQNFSIDNYKWGFIFSMPIFLRRERSNIQKGRIKIQELILDIENKKNKLQNKIESSWKEQNLLQRQLALLNRNVQNYKLLLDGENEKFNFGESSVFLLNKRQEKYINAQLKLIETHINQQRKWLDFLYYSNQLIDQ